MPKIIIYSDEQEMQEIVVEDNGVVTFSLSQNHDLHGWDGMEVASDIAEGIGKALNVPVVKAFKEFD